MNQGQLLALDSPSRLKRTVVTGAAWDVVAEPLISALDALNGMPHVAYAGLLGDHLHAITNPDSYTAASLQAALVGAGFPQAHVEQAEVTLEDVFTELAVRRALPTA
jgi:hypothetical protein